MKHKKFMAVLFGVFFSIFIIFSSVACDKKISTDFSEFIHEKKVRIIGYNGDAMEPFITKDEKYLFFNNAGGQNNKDIYYAEKINNTTFEFKGEVKGVNTSYVEANPTMDEYNNFYFISTRNIANSNKTIYCGIFNNGTVSKVHQINGTINIEMSHWINMGVEISKDGNIIFVSNAKFRKGDKFPKKGNIRFAIKNDNNFNIPNNETEILENINKENAIEYAGELSSDKLEFFYSEVVLSNPPIFKLYYVKRKNVNEKFSVPIAITEPFEKNKYAVVEAPSLSNDGKRLYYHKLNLKGIYSIFMLSKKQ